MLSVYFVAAAYVERAWFGYKYLILFLQSFPHLFLPSWSEAKGTFLDVVSDYKESCLLQHIDILVEKMREDLMLWCIVSLT